MNPNNWDSDPESGSIYCPVWLQSFALRHVGWWFWVVRVRYWISSKLRAVK